SATEGRTSMKRNSCALNALSCIARLMAACDHHRRLNMVGDWPAERRASCSPIRRISGSMVGRLGCMHIPRPYHLELLFLYTARILRRNFLRRWCPNLPLLHCDSPLKQCVAEKEEEE